MNIKYNSWFLSRSAFLLCPEASFVIYGSQSHRSSKGSNLFRNRGKVAYIRTSQTPQLRELLALGGPLYTRACTHTCTHLFNALSFSPHFITWFSSNRSCIIVLEVYIIDTLVFVCFVDSNHTSLLSFLNYITQITSY